MSTHDWRQLAALLIELRKAPGGAQYVKHMLAVRQWVDDYVARQAQDWA